MNGLRPRIVGNRALDDRGYKNEHSDPSHQLFPAAPAGVSHHFCTGK